MHFLGFKFGDMPFLDYLFQLTVGDKTILNYDIEKIRDINLQMHLPKSEGGTHHDGCN